MTDDRIYTAALIIIGNEILSGRTQDANLAYVANGLNKSGVRLAEVRVVPDIDTKIIKAVNELRIENDYVFTTGGIGPTHDDITSHSIAAAFGVKVIRHPDAEKLLRDHYGADINDSRLKMAEVPEGSDLIPNPVSRAPGFRITNVHVLAGVPRIMKAQFDGVCLQLAGGKPVKSRSLVAHLAESVMAEELGKIQERYPSSDVGSYPFMRAGKSGTAIVVRDIEQVTVDAVIEEVRTMMTGFGVEPEVEVQL
jgi:molybdenum cofactor synthesis domain-containing protein